jgi:hypothetical protein
MGINVVPCVEGARTCVREEEAAHGDLGDGVRAGGHPTLSWEPCHRAGAGRSAAGTPARCARGCPRILSSTSASVRIISASVLGWPGPPVEGGNQAARVTRSPSTSIRAAGRGGVVRHHQATTAARP